MIKPVKTLVVLVDGERARFLSGIGRCMTFQSVAPGEMEDPEAGKPNRDLASDKPGRTASSKDGIRSSMETTDFHRREKQLFARSVAGIVDKIAGDPTYDRLVLVAPPSTLGELRAHLNKHTTGRITGEVAKDLTKIPDHELRSHLEGVLPP
jgi:protein required for attachment to host cells